MTPRFIPDLIDVEQELFELPQRVRPTIDFVQIQLIQRVQSGACYV